MQNYARVGGVLSIVAGGLGVFYLLGAILFIIAMYVGSAGWDYYGAYDGYGWYGAGIFYAVVIVWCLVMTLLGALAIVGGIFALRKRVWGLALAGAIAGTLVFFPCGIIAIIFTALGKPEFDITTKPAPAAIQT